MRLAIPKKKTKKNVWSLPEILDESILTGQVKELQEEPEPLDDLGGAHAEDPAEVHHCLADGELAVEGDLLRHVADTFARDAWAFGTRLAAQDPDFSRVQSATTYYTWQQSRLAATAGTQ